VKGIRARILSTVRSQLEKGADGHSLALACAAGGALGAFPLIGATTILCLIAGYLMNLNHPVLQAVNYAMAPVQLLLIPVFGFLAMKIGGPIEADLNPAVIVREFMNSPLHFLEVYGELGLKAVMVWAVTAPVAAYIIYRLCLAPFLRLERAMGGSR